MRSRPPNRRKMSSTSSPSSEKSFATDGARAPAPRRGARRGQHRRRRSPRKTTDEDRLEDVERREEDRRSGVGTRSGCRRARRARPRARRRRAWRRRRSRRARRPRARWCAPRRAGGRSRLSPQVGHRTAKASEEQDDREGGVALRVRERVEVDAEEARGPDLPCPARPRAVPGWRGPGSRGAGPGRGSRPRG